MNIQLLSRIETRPQSELRHLFDLLNELLCLVDPLQTARIAAVMHGLVNRPSVGSDAHGWCPRPNVDPHLWAWSMKELDSSLHAMTILDEKREEPELLTVQTSDSGDASDGATTEVEEVPPAWPAMPKGLLELITTEAYRDSRRAYQCMKFIVHLSSKTDAVVSYLSGFPDRWEPAVKWLENLMESSDEIGPTRVTGASCTANLKRMDGSFNRLGGDEADSGALYMVLPSGSAVPESGRRVLHLTDASNESEENSTGFQRTVSAQTTLREATRILFTMPRMRPEPTGLSALPAVTHSAHQEGDEEEEDEYERRKNTSLFYKL
ncbi:unnamed protein product [Echinostoma caproni]|uniref:EST1_DNA_bind domain-containing protein n=1 Tax=Echinostoma caproni TaxID=27848 RepID=A0A183B6B2_9TREM|nr:unnamed protein product [Echinostoma caproni]